MADAGAGVTYGGGGQAEGVTEVDALEGEDGTAEKDEADVDDGEGVDALDDMLGDDLPARPQGQNGVGMRLAFELVEQVLDEDHEATHLESATGGASAPGHDDDEEGDDGKEGAPGGIVDGQ